MSATSDANHVNASSSPSSEGQNDVLNDILVQPKQKETSHQKRKAGINQNSVRLTDDNVLSDLKEEVQRKKDNKLEKMERKRIYEDEKGREREALKNRKRREKNVAKKKGRRRSRICKNLSVDLLLMVMNQMQNVPRVVGYTQLTNKTCGSAATNLRSLLATRVCK